MTAPREEVATKARRWAVYAEEDLRVAQHTLALSDRCPYRLVAYHAQQCAEKYLKAYLVVRGIDFPYTHNIARLLELCSSESGWAQALEDAEELTPFAITARYPGEDEPVDETEARRATEIAAHVRAVVKRALRDEGLSL